MTMVEIAACLCEEKKAEERERERVNIRGRGEENLGVEYALGGEEWWEWGRSV